MFLGAVGGVSWGRRPGAPPNRWAFHQIGPVPALSSPEREVVAAGVPGEGTGALSSPAASTITLLGTDRWVWRTRGGAHGGGQSRDPGFWGHSGSQVRWHLVTCETKQVPPPLYTVVSPDRSSTPPLRASFASLGVGAPMPHCQTGGLWPKSWGPEQLPPKPQSPGPRGLLTEGVRAWRHQPGGLSQPSCLNRAEGVVRSLLCALPPPPTPLKDFAFKREPGVVTAPGFALPVRQAWYPHSRPGDTEHRKLRAGQCGVRSHVVLFEGLWGHAGRV